MGLSGPVRTFAAAAAGYLVLWVFLGFFSDRQWDFTVYHLAANAASEGENPYDRETLYALAGGQGIGYAGLPFLYPPHVLRLLEPLAWFSHDTAKVVWLILKCAALEACVWIMIPLLGFRRFWLPFAALHAAAIVYRPVRLDLNSGNVAVFEMAMLYLSLLWWKRGRSGPAAALLALAGSVKIHPLLLALYPLHLRDWRFMRGFAAGLACVAALWLIDIEMAGRFAAFFRSPRWALIWDEQVQSFFNCSAATVIVRTFSETYFAQPLINAPYLVPFLVPAFAVGVFLLAGRMLVRKAPDEGGGPVDGLVPGFLICAMLLLPPRLAGYTLAWTLYPLIAASVAAVRRGSFAAAAMTAASMLLLQIDIPPQHVEIGGPSQLLIDKDFFGLLSLFSAYCLLLGRNATMTDGPEADGNGGGWEN